MTMVQMAIVFDPRGGLRLVPYRRGAAAPAT